MLIRHRKRSDAREWEVTPEGLYLNRRRFIAGAGAAAAAGLLAGTTACAEEDDGGKDGGKDGGGTAGGRALKAFDDVKDGPFSTDETPTDIEDVTTYNNFLEFGSGKTAPAIMARDFEPRPWSVKVDGACERPGTYDLDDVIDVTKLEERIYRLRCVEAWSMVIPWVGVPLRDVVDRFEPASAARYVQFETLLDPDRMPGEKRASFPWPYVEGLRMDEARHPLALLAVGLYGKELPNQNGAPLRLVVPWKYGFKSIKSIVRIKFTAKPPATTWALLQPDEYGFYANVNPKVDHPRWSQARERRIGDFFKRDTPMFNGYEDEVASLYDGMDLEEDF